FGDSVMNSAGQIDRAKLADIVFIGSDNLLSLNKIVHPYVLQRTEQLIEQYNEQAEIKAIVLDMPLLVEVGWAKRCDRLIFVDCSEQLRCKRAKKAKLFDKKQLKIRENFQISLDSKAKLADNAIDNSSDLSILTKQVTDIFSTLFNG
ncbi:MAG: dephospho-CoA kinase, partial [Planctomycetota bacterium]